MHPTICYLKNKNLLWQANHTQSIDNGQHTGFNELDKALQGGFPEYGVIDIRRAAASLPTTATAT